MANNTNLGAAKAAKNDEFYTQYADIQKEVNAYLEDNPDTFRDKTVLLPCDDPEWSKGGSTDIENCQMLCKTHNRAKGNR
ncbi:MAG: HNH endonuclease [Prevotella sp.]|nr:HNH endonuclease [Prevotella sp.]